MMKTKHGTKYVKRILIASTKWKLKEIKKNNNKIQTQKMILTLDTLKWFKLYTNTWEKLN